MAATEWVEIIEPRTKEHMFANLTTGECVWDPPVGVPVKKTDDNQWWELFDQNTSRFYYYNAASQKTVWHKPTGCDIIPLAKLQTLKQNTEPKDSSNKLRSTVSSETFPGTTLSPPSTQPSGLKAQKGVSPGSTKITTSTDAQTSPENTKSKRYRTPRCRAHSTTCSLSSSSLPSQQKSKSKPETSSRYSSRKHRQSNPDNSDRISVGSASDKSIVSMPSTSIKRNSVGQTSLHSAPATAADRLSDRLSLDGAKHSFNNGGVKYYGSTGGQYGVPGRDPVGQYGKGFGTQYASVRYPSSSGYVYQVPLSKQRSLEGDHFRILQSPPGQEGSLSRSISFMARNDPLARNGEGIQENGRRSVESTPQSARRYPLPSPDGSDRRRHSRNSSISSTGNPITNAMSGIASSMSSFSNSLGFAGHSNVDGFPTPMINRRTVPGSSAHDPRRVLPTHTSESEESTHSPHKERKKKGDSFLDSGSTLDADNKKSNKSLSQDINQPSYRRPERSLTSLSLQVKKWKNKAGKSKSKEDDIPAANSFSSPHQKPAPPPIHTKPTLGTSNHTKPIPPVIQSKPNQSLNHSKSNPVSKGKQHGGKEVPQPKISPLQQYILEQAKLSGYRFGDKLGVVKRDSFIDSESESHKTGDDSDAFADDEAPSSDGYEERDDISLVSTVSSVGEDDNYLTEPTYNNLDPVWAQRHGFPLGKYREYGSIQHIYTRPENALDIDTFSEEFDLRMKYGRTPASSTIPRPTHSLGGSIPSSLPPSLPLRPGSAMPPPRDLVDGRGDLMSSSHLSENTSGSTLSVSASIHSTLSAGTLADFENFAASNLNIQKKGIFRKKMSLKDVLSWQSEAISKPLTFVTDKLLKKEAVNVFKLVQIYMSDRKAKIGMTINSVAMDIAEAGYTSSNLRDEIYIQLCKQTCENPRRESLRRGWELIAICLAFFPPSETFYPYLHGFILKHRDPSLDFPEIGRWPIHVQISHYAGICHKRLERIGIGGRLMPKKPSQEDIDQSRLQIFRPSMFGGTLEEVLDIQKDKFPTRRLPWILTTLTEQILGLNGLSTEGIFRIPADFDEVSSSKCRYDQWEVSSCSDAHVPAALLKLWLRELYVPLIPDDRMYNEAILVGEDSEAANAVVKQLPDLHQLVILYLIRFLQIFNRPEVVSITKMDASNLSMVFAPNFLRCSSSDPTIIMENTRKEMAFVKTLIHSLDTEHMQGIL